MKTLFFLTLFSLILPLTTHAREQEHHGYLKSGGGLCSVLLEKQNDFYYQLRLTSPELNLRVANIELKSGKFTSFNEVFERDGDDYEHLYFGVPYPRLYKIAMKNLGKGKFQIIKTTLIFGKETFTKKDVCITKH